MPSRSVVDSRTGTSWNVVRRLGKGAFATCYLVNAKSRSVPAVAYALKKFSRQATDDGQRYAKICNEVDVHARLCSGLQHPSIVEMLGAFDSDEGDVCMLLTYCANGNLADLVERLDSRALVESDAVRLLRQLLSAVDYMHSVHDVLHRDIKPGNILLTDNYILKLADFGLACTSEESRRRLSVCGTPNYVSPEIINYRGHAFTSDYWAVACTFYFMLCGSTPFQTSTIKATYARICRADYGWPEKFAGSTRAKDFINRVLIVEPNRRSTMREMLSHSVFALVRRNSMTNLLSASSSYESSIRPLSNLSKCQSVYDINNNRPSADHHFEDLLLFLRSIQGVIAQSDNQLDYGLVHTNRPLPDHWIVKWVDWCNKFGFSTTLRNGVRSVLFNDDSIISTNDNENYIYHPTKTHRLCSRWDQHMMLCPNYQAKRDTLQYVIGYMDKELISSVSLTDQDDGFADGTCGIGIYVCDIMKLDGSIVFLLSDGSIQINFLQHRLKIMLRRERDVTHMHVVSANAGISAFAIEDHVRPSDRVSTPSWMLDVAGIVQTVMQRQSVARRSTKC